MNLQLEDIRLIKDALIVLFLTVPRERNLIDIEKVRKMIIKLDVILDNAESEEQES